jgi:hypothetical protein
MPRIINDEFTNLPITKQYRRQLRLQRDGKCITCGDDRTDSKVYCPGHAAYFREKKRDREGSERRYKGARSYHNG